MEVLIHFFKCLQPGIANTMLSEPDLLDLIQLIKDKEQEDCNALSIRPKSL